MAHAQKPDLVFQRNGWVHLNWRRSQFSRLLAAEVCASAVVMVVMLDYTMFWGRVQYYWLPTPLARFPFTSPTVRHRVSSGFNWALSTKLYGVTSQLKISEGRYCSRTLAAYWTTSPLAFTHVPPDVTTSKLCEDLMFVNSVWHCAYKNLWFISMKKLATFGYIVDVFLSRKFKFISENFKLVSWRK